MQDDDHVSEEPEPKLTLNDLQLARVKLYELPMSLLVQKRDWDVKAFLAWALEQPDNFAAAFVAYFEEQPVCCFWYTGSSVYKKIIIDTFIVDEDFREPELVQQLMRLAVRTASYSANRMGYDAVAWSSAPKLATRMLEYLREEGLEVVEHTLAIKLRKDDGS